MSESFKSLFTVEENFTEPNMAETHGGLQEVVVKNRKLTAKWDCKMMEEVIMKSEEKR